MRLEGKVSVITGAGTGIGAATAELFAREGAKLVLVGRRREPLESTAKRVEEQGAECITAPLDVSREEDVAALLQAARERFGRVDVLFNNAAVISGEPRDITAFDQAEYQRIMDINVKGVMLCCKYALPIMIEQGAGSIINNSSIAGVRGSVIDPAYGASKAAVVNLTQTLARSHAHQGVRVNTVSPGFIITPMSDTNEPEMLERAVRNIPMGRAAQPLEVAYAVLFLASEEASYISGINILVDGAQALGVFR